MKHTIPLLVIALLFSCVSQTPRIPDITVDRDSRKYTAGDAEVQMQLAFSLGGLRKYDLGVTYYLYDDLVCLEYKMEFVNHYLFLDRDGRNAFSNALENYKIDYAARNLVNKAKVTKQSYGVARSLLIWEAFSFSGEGRSNPNLQLGYAFAKNSPYFTITMPEAPNISKKTNDKTKNSAKQVFYFTRAQADILAALFDEDYLLSLHQSPDTPSRPTSRAVETEEYEETEGEYEEEDEGED